VRVSIVTMIGLLGILTAIGMTATSFADGPEIVGENVVVNGDFEGEGAAGNWGSGLHLVEEGAYRGEGCGMIDSTIEGGRSYIAQSRIPIAGNTHYEFSMAARRETGEGYVYVHCNWQDADGKYLMSSKNWKAGRAMPVTLRTGEGTGDWRTYSGVFRCPRMDVVSTQVVVFIKDGADRLYVDEISIREVKYPEAPAWELPEAVTFEGHPSRIGMAVEEASVDGQVFSVRTTGADYVLDAAAGTMTCGQRIGAEREVATVDFGGSLGELRIASQDEEVCVLQGDELVIGFQGDSLVTIATNRAMTATVTSQIGAEWFRKQDPHMMAIDEQGGFCVTPHSRAEYESPGVSVTGPEDATDQPGWTMSYTIGARDMWAMAVFPGREFDWQTSFEKRIVGTSGCPDPEALREYAKHASVLFIFAGIYKEHYAGYCHAPYELKDPAKLRATIALAHELGMEVIIYRHPTSYEWADMSLDDFLADLKEFRDEYGFDGWYFDGYPGWSTWLNSYRAMRIVRDRVGDATLYIHCTLNPPIRMTELYAPFVDSYATFLLRAEAQFINGPTDPYLRYVVNTRHISNCIATIKANEMRAEALPADATPEQIKEAPKASLRLQLETMLKLNGRCRWAYPGWPLRASDTDDYIGYYFAEVDRRQKQWEETGEPMPMQWP